MSPFLLSFAWIGIMVLLTVTLPGCDKHKDEVSVLGETGAPTQSIMEVIAGNASLSMINSALLRTHLDTLLSGKASYTFYAPTDNAFSQAGITPETIGTMNMDTLKILVKNHIVKGFYPSDMMPLYTTYRLRNLDSLALFIEGGIHYVTDNQVHAVYPLEYYVNGVLADSVDKMCTNGVLHLMGGTLTVPSSYDVTTLLAKDSRFSLYSYALKKTGLDSLLLRKKNIGTDYATVFAPVNEAMIATGIMRNKVAIDSMLVVDPAHLRAILSFCVVSPVVYGNGSSPAHITLNPFFPVDLLNLTYGNGGAGYGLLGPSLYPPSPTQVLIFIQTNAQRSISLSSAGIDYYNTLSWSTQFAHTGAPVRASNGLIYPLDLIWY